MGEHTHISWADHTFNPWIGCMQISPACDGCYALNLMDTRLGRVEFGGPGRGVGTRSRTTPANWRKPLKWDRQAKEAGTRPFVFGGSLMDPFDNAVPAEWRREYFDQVIRPTRNLVWLLLTKRPQNIVPMVEAAGGLPPNVALGTTAEDQARWDTNVPALIAAQVAFWAKGAMPLFSFVSMEPLLERVLVRTARVTDAIRRNLPQMRYEFFDPLHPHQFEPLKLHWIITGGETDQGTHKARPMHPQAVRWIRDDCRVTETPFHHKQNGEWVSTLENAGRGDHQAIELERDWWVRRVGKKRAGRTIDGHIHDARPYVRDIAA